MSIKILADSTCDLNDAQKKELDIMTVPLRVIFDDAEYFDRIDIAPRDFFLKMERTKNLPTTAAVSPESFIKIFEAARVAGDEVIAILASSELSGVFQSAVIAKRRVGYDKIYLIDSRKVTLASYQLLHLAASLRDKNYSAEEIYEQVLNLIPKVKFRLLVDTLEYLKKGGRISNAAALVGGMLHIKPIVEMVEGKARLVSKALGYQKGLLAMVDYIKNNPIDFEYPVVIAYTFSRKVLEDFVHLIKESGIKMMEYIEIEAGPVIGTHVGPNCVAISYIGK